MTDLAVEISHTKRESCYNYALDIGVRDALARLIRERWPEHTAKMTAREWDLSLAEARGVIAGRTSLSTLDKIIRHPRGGLALLIAVGSTITGQSLHQFVEQEQKRARHERERYAASVTRFAEMARDLPALLSVDLGSAAGRRRMDRKRAE